MMPRDYGVLNIYLPFRILSLQRYNLLRLFLKALNINDFSNLTLNFAGSIQVEANLIFQHPRYNTGFVIISHDPKIIDIPVVAVKFSTVPLKTGDKVTYIGFTNYKKMFTKTVRVSSTTFSQLSKMVYFGHDDLGVAGVFVDPDGIVRAIYEFSHGAVDVTNILDVITALQKDTLTSALCFPVAAISYNIYRARQVEVPEGKLNTYFFID